MHTLRNDNKAVSPVIGVVLMVAITVLLAATAAVFFFELGNDQGMNMTPTAAFDVSYENSGSSDVLTISHTTGDDLEARHLSIVISGASPSAVNKRYAVESITSYGPGSTLTAGEQIRLDKSALGVGSNIDFSKATVRVVWQGAGTSKSKILREWKGPDA